MEHRFGLPYHNGFGRAEECNSLSPPPFSFPPGLPLRAGCFGWPLACCWQRRSAPSPSSCTSKPRCFVPNRDATLAREYRYSLRPSLPHPLTLSHPSSLLPSRFTPSSEPSLSPCTPTPAPPPGLRRAIPSTPSTASHLPPTSAIAPFPSTQLLALSPLPPSPPSIICSPPSISHLSLFDLSLAPMPSQLQICCHSLAGFKMIASQHQSVIVCLSAGGQAG